MGEAERVLNKISKEKCMMLVGFAWYFDRVVSFSSLSTRPRCQFASDDHTDLFSMNTNKKYFLFFTLTTQLHCVTPQPIVIGSGGHMATMVLSCCLWKPKRPVQVKMSG